MKTFKQFLNEAEYNEVLELIEKNCGPFLEESKRNAFLYRGVQGLEKTELHLVNDIDGEEMQYGIKSVRSDREPKDTANFIHKWIDQWFDEKMGFKARTQAVFCFGERASITDIRHYGKPCIIFPIGEIEYTWSRGVEDLFTDMSEMFGMKSAEDVNNWLDEAGYIKTGLSEAVTRSHEIMIQCRRYYAFPIDYEDALKKSLGFR